MEDSPVPSGPGVAASRTAVLADGGEHHGSRLRSYRWDDPAASAAAARQLDGIAFLEEILAGRIPPPPIAATLGFGLVSVEPGRAVFGFTPAGYHYNPIGSVHGGVYATLCDSACGCAVHSMLPAGAHYTSMDLAIRFLRPVTIDSGRLLCEGTVIHMGSRTALAEARLTGADGKLYAHATSSCLIFRPGG
jgi:uncharacterized protein (TIGR00369 family)